MCSNMSNNHEFAYARMSNCQFLEFKFWFEFFRNSLKKKFRFFDDVFWLSKKEGFLYPDTIVYSRL